MRRRFLFSLVLAVSALSLLAVPALAQGPTPNPSPPTGAWGWMRGGRGMMGGVVPSQVVTPTQTVTPTMPFGRGMMGPVAPSQAVTQTQTVTPTTPYGRGMMGWWQSGRVVTPTVPYGRGMMGWWQSGRVVTPTVPYGRGMMGWWQSGQVVTPTMPYGPGMMGGRGMMGRWQSGQGVTPTAPCGPGMMGGRGMMGRWQGGQVVTPTLPVAPAKPVTPALPLGRGMRNRPGSAANARTVTLDQAVSSAQQFIAGYNNKDLVLVRVEEYTSGYYGVVQEKSTGINAFQIVINKNRGVVVPETGPNQAWNSKNVTGRSMAGGAGQTAGKMTVTLDQARASAAQYLKTNLPKATVANQGDTFYGYTSFDVLVDGKVYGKLSVNGYTGVAWYHTWRGAFVSAKTIQ